MLGDMLMDKRILLPNVGSACRCLFGPVDHDEVRKTLRRELKVNAERKKAMWNFDFTLEKPLPGPWDWQRSEPYSVPSAYAMPQLNVQMDVRVCKMEEIQVPTVELRDEGVEREEEVAEVEEEEGQSLAGLPTVAPTTSADEDTAARSASTVTCTTTSTQTSPKKRKRQTEMTEYYQSVKKSRTSESKLAQP